jgi:hypothetical protein
MTFGPIRDCIVDQVPDLCHGRRNAHFRRLTDDRAVCGVQYYDHEGSFLSVG